MNAALYAAAAGSLAQERRLDVLTNNLANVHTAGFKQDRPSFETYLRAATPMVVLASTRPDLTAGALATTGNSLDLGLDGPGFFVVQTPQGVRYTRQGSFRLDARNQLVTQDGHPVLGEGGPLVVNGRAVTVDAQGQIEVDGKRVGRLRLVELQPEGLRKSGGTLFESAGVPPAAPRSTQVRQGHLELSNVNPARAMTELIEVLRTYEAYQKTIQSIQENRSRATEMARLA